ncbi:hypothetical protein SAMN04487783_1618 [Agrococcus baldri]|uniref:Uncharacterized protein n=1 Tax=Agrococcus baldri TaxID=153730 RepID=A0AA94HMP1_9MICO|nr:hypothetical protein [Agrococcus baldri]SFS11711.1 hypothetical protein SAMN04487783_1618 [Agrococcus baldri]
MTVPNPNPYAQQPGQPVQNPAPGYAGGLPPQPFAQDPAFQPQRYPQDPGMQQQPYPQPYAQQQPYVPPVYDAGPPRPPRPKLTKAAAHRARLAGGIGGGITWLGLGITQLAAIFLLLPAIVGAVVYGIGFALAQDGTSATADVWGQTLAWLGSPWGIVIAIGIPAGIVIALLGLWISTRMLRHPGLRRPVGVTWAGFGIAVAATVLLSGFGSLTLPFFGGLPFGDGADFDPGDFGPGGVDPGTMDQAEAQEWLLEGGAGVLEQFADPGVLLGVLGPWIALGQLLALIVPIAVSVFTWWWMAHAMRPATTDATDAEAADASTASAA